MDQEKVGKLIAAMRKERGLTQEALGEKLGVTNKTVSRWETGAYMPDIDKLQALSAVLGISVNELLAGERITDADDFAQKADENLMEALSEKSAFGLQDRMAFFRQKWLREHKGYIALWTALWLVVFAVAVYLRQPVMVGVTALFALLIYGHIRNRMMSYVEKNAFM